jgi:hypothetical protein
VRRDSVVSAKKKKSSRCADVAGDGDSLRVPDIISWLEERMDMAISIGIKTGDVFSYNLTVFSHPFPLRMPIAMPGNAS